MANKLGRVHYDSKRLPPDLEDRTQYRALATAYDWDNQSIMHAGLVMVGLACIEILNAPAIRDLLHELEDFHLRRQDRLMRGDKGLWTD